MELQIPKMVFHTPYPNFQLKKNCVLTPKLLFRISISDTILKLFMKLPPGDKAWTALGKIIGSVVV